MDPREIQVEILSRALSHFLKVNEGICIDLEKIKVVVFRAPDETIQISDLDDKLEVVGGQMLWVHPSDMDAQLYRIIEEEKEKEKEKRDNEMEGPMDGPQG